MAHIICEQFRKAGGGVQVNDLHQHTQCYTSCYRRYYYQWRIQPHIAGLPQHQSSRTWGSRTPWSWQITSGFWPLEGNELARECERDELLIRAGGSVPLSPTIVIVDCWPQRENIKETIKVRLATRWVPNEAQVLMGESTTAYPTNDHEHHSFIIQKCRLYLVTIKKIIFNI